MSSARAKPVVGVISEFFVGSTSIDTLAKHCPSVSIVEIDHTGKKIGHYFEHHYFEVYTELYLLLEDVPRDVAKSSPLGGCRIVFT